MIWNPFLVKIYCQTVFLIKKLLLNHLFVFGPITKQNIVSFDVLFLKFIYVLFKLWWHQFRVFYLHGVNLFYNWTKRLIDWLLTKLSRSWLFWFFSYFSRVAWRIHIYRNKKKNYKFKVGNIKDELRSGKSKWLNNKYNVSKNKKK